MNEAVKALVTAFNAAAALADWTFFRAFAEPTQPEQGQDTDAKGIVGFESGPVGSRGAGDTMTWREGIIRVDLLWPRSDSPSAAELDKGYDAAEAMWGVLTAASREVSSGGETFRLMTPTLDCEASPEYVGPPWDPDTAHYRLAVRMRFERIA